jgi:hypothetical protein
MYRACFLNGLLHMFTRKKTFWKVQRRCEIDFAENFTNTPLKCDPIWCSIFRDLQNVKSLRTDGKTLSDGKSSHDLFGQISKTVKYPNINNVLFPGTAQLLLTCIHRMCCNVQYENCIIIFRLMCQLRRDLLLPIRMHPWISLCILSKQLNIDK